MFLYLSLTLLLICEKTNVVSCLNSITSHHICVLTRSTSQPSSLHLLTVTVGLERWRFLRHVHRVKPLPAAGLQPRVFHTSLDRDAFLHLRSRRTGSSALCVRAWTWREWVATLEAGYRLPSQLDVPNKLSPLVEHFFTALLRATAGQAAPWKPLITC